MIEKKTLAMCTPLDNYLWESAQNIILVWITKGGMGNDVSCNNLLLQDLVETMRSIKQRIGVLETETAALRKSVINNNVAHNEHSRLLSRIDEHIFNVKLLEEGRSRSVRHHKPNKYHTKSLILK